MSKNKNKLNKSNGSSPDFSVFLSVFGYCLLIIVLPITSYFGTKMLLDSYLDLTYTQVSIWSAVTAVISLHVALGLYLYKAYSSDKPKPQDKQE